jgi:tetratricopeptide (TPR) repeat protein
MIEYPDLLSKAIAADDAGRIDLADELFKQCLKREPQFSFGWLYYASFLMEQNRWNDAIKAARHATNSDDPSHCSQAYSIIGQCYQEQELYTRAVVAFRKSLAAMPKATTYVFLGYCLDDDSPDDALTCYQQAISLEPDFEEAHYNLGCSYKKKGEHKHAEKCFRRAIEFDPDYSRAYAELAFSLMRPGPSQDNQEARRLLEKSIELEPHYGWSRLYFANLLWALKEFDAAEEQYKAAIKLWPDSSLAYCWYGDFIASAREDLARARVYLKRAVRLGPQDDESLYSLGLNLLNSGKIKDGEKYLRKSAALGNQNAHKLLKKIPPYVRKKDRRPTCRCGNLLKKGQTWCDECCKSRKR